MSQQACVQSLALGRCSEHGHCNLTDQDDIHYVTDRKAKAMKCDD